MSILGFFLLVVVVLLFISGAAFAVHSLFWIALIVLAITAVLYFADRRGPGTRL